MVVFKYKSGETIGINAVGFSITDGLYTLIGENERRYLRHFLEPCIAV